MKKYEFDNTRSKTYDDSIRRSILGYDALHKLTARLAAAVNPDLKQVLLAGAGTGQELETFSIVSQDCVFSIVEPSFEMQAQCKNRINFLKLQSRIKGIYSSIDEIPPGLQFDCVTLMLVLHFLPDNGDNHNALAKIFERMKVNSYLFIADLCKESVESEKFLIETWRNSMLLEDSTLEEVEDFFSNRLPLVHRVSLQRTQHLLSETGFENHAIYFSSLLFKAWFAQKCEG